VPEPAAFVIAVMLTIVTESGVVSTELAPPEYL
jgi:hypothetical protein